MEALKKIFLQLESSKKYFIALSAIFVFISLINILFYFSADKISDTAYDDYFNASYKTLNIRIPKNLNFAGEKTPITNFRVKQAAERELLISTYWRSQSLLLHKRSNRWFPIIEPILEKNGIPADFKYVALIESQLSNVISPQGATGFWQIMEPTGKNYGLEITGEVDERYHVVKSTEAACKYFKEAYKIFKNWTLVAASYNLGMGGIQGQLNKQKVDSYYNLTLTQETARYVYRILAMKEIISRPKVYGYVIRKKNLYPPLSTTKITVDSTINNLAEFAINQGINYKILKLYNPWLLTNSLHNEQKKKYIIEIPKGSVDIYDMEGTYEGSDRLSSSDSSNLTIPPPLLIDSVDKKEEVEPATP